MASKSRTTRCSAPAEPSRGRSEASIGTRDSLCQAGSSTWCSPRGAHPHCACRSAARSWRNLPLREAVDLGFQYYAPQMTEVAYRGHDAFSGRRIMRACMPNSFQSESVREERLRYLENENVDTAFLLRVKE